MLLATSLLAGDRQCDCSTSPSLSSPRRVLVDMRGMRSAGASVRSSGLRQRVLPREPCSGRHLVPRCPPPCAACTHCTSSHRLCTHLVPLCGPRPSAAATGQGQLRRQPPAGEDEGTRASQHPGTGLSPPGAGGSREHRRTPWMDLLPGLHLASIEFQSSTETDACMKRLRKKCSQAT
jgi:hypothetical protein